MFANKQKCGSSHIVLSTTACDIRAKKCRFFRHGYFFLWINGSAGGGGGMIKSWWSLLDKAIVMLLAAKDFSCAYLQGRLQLVHTNSSTSERLGIILSLNLGKNGACYFSKKESYQLQTCLVTMLFLSYPLNSSSQNARIGAEKVISILA